MTEGFNAFEAYADAYAAMLEATPGQRIAAIGRPGSLLCAVTPFSSANFNRVTRVRLMAEEVESAIEAVKATHASAGVSGSWWLDPASTPADLDRALERHGYVALDRAPAMARELKDLPATELPHGVELSFVRGREARREASIVAARGFGRPEAMVQRMADAVSRAGDFQEGRVRIVVAKLDGVAVSAATGVTAGDVCGVFNVATLPEARGKGLGSLTTLAVLHDARDRGARHAVLHASQMGFPVYVRMGFEHAGDFRRFVQPQLESSLTA